MQDESLFLCGNFVVHTPCGVYGVTSYQASARVCVFLEVSLISSARLVLFFILSFPDTTCPSCEAAVSRWKEIY